MGGQSKLSQPRGDSAARRALSARCSVGASRRAETRLREWYHRETYKRFFDELVQETVVSSNCHRPTLAPVHYNSCAIDEHLSSVSSSCGCMDRSLE